MKDFAKKSISTILKKTAIIPSESTSWYMFCEPKLPKVLIKSDKNIAEQSNKKEK